MESTDASFAASSKSVTASRSRGRPRKTNESKYTSAYVETRASSMKVSLARMNQAYRGQPWVNRKMRRSFHESCKSANRNGGFLPLIEVRRLFGRWIQSLQGSHGYMKHKASRDEAEVEVPDGYIIPPINFHRSIRGHIFAEFWDDADLKNCHFVLTRDICSNLNIACPAIRQYIQDREAILLSIIKHCGDKISRDDAKALLLRLLYGGSWSGFVHDITRPRRNPDGSPKPPVAKLSNRERHEPHFCRELYDEMTRIYSDWTVADAVEYAKVLEQKVAVAEAMHFADDHRSQTPARKLQSKCYATYVQTHERKIIDACMKHCKERGLDVGFYMYDGFLVEKGCGTPELLATFKRIALSLGFDVDFEIKPMALVPEWESLPTDLPDDEDEVNEVDAEPQPFAALSPGPAWEAHVQRAVDEGTHVSDESLALIVAPFAQGKFIADINSASVNWYHFSGHRWRRDYHNVQLQKLMTGTVLNSIIALSESKDWLVNIIENRLTDTNAQKRAAIALRKHLPAPEGWVSQLDMNTNLLCFEDGVLEFNDGNLVFRDGRPDDMCTKSTKRNFPTVSNPEIRARINKFYKDVYPDEGVRELMWKDHAHCLRGTSNFDVFWFFLGNQMLGANGKGTRAALIVNAMGDYVYECDSKIMSQQSGSAGSTSSELVKVRGCRRVIMMEAEDVIRNKLLKERTAGGKIQGRQLFHDAVEFKPIAIWEMQCNEMPEIDRQDGGTFRRVRVVPHIMMFVDNPKPGCNNQLPLDKDLREKFDSDPAYGEEYMLMLLDRHRNGTAMIDAKVDFPKAVLDLTREKLDSTNVVKQFVDKFLVVTGSDDNRIKTTDIWDSFKKSECYRQGMRSSQLYTGLEACGLRKGKSDAIMYFAGVRFVDRECDFV